MANPTIKLLTIVLFLALISHGYSTRCNYLDITVQQSQTGAKVQEKTEWNVIITNNCTCVQLDVMLNCKGFKSFESISPSILKVMGNACLVNDGQVIYGPPITFKYASDKKFPFTPISSTIACS